MDKKRIKKIAILTMISSMLLSGCNSKKEVNNEIKEEQITTESEIVEEISQDNEIFNETIENIYNEYKNKTNKDIKIEDLYIKKNFDLQNLHKKGEEYIYDYRINNDNNQGYTYVDPGYCSKMYTVVLHDGDNYEPICALAKVNSKIINVKVTVLIDNQAFEPSENYIYIDATEENFNNLKNGQEYINNTESKNTYILKNNYLA